MPSRTDWLLAFIAGESPDDDAVDRIRIMKGLFLFQEEGNAPAEVDYDFQPYNYGPFAQAIYAGVESLIDQGLVEATGPWAYQATPEGYRRIKEMQMQPAMVKWLQDLRAELVALDFSGLLKRVYAKHPESATESLATDVVESLAAERAALIHDALKRDTAGFDKAHRGFLYFENGGKGYTRDEFLATLSV